MECLQEKNSWDENSGPHWMSYTHENRNNSKMHPKKIKNIFGQHTGISEKLSAWTTKLYSRYLTCIKGLFVYNMKVGRQFWTQLRNQLCSKYTQNNQVDNKSTIPFDVLMSTFELPSLSSPVQTNVSGTEARLHRISPKWTCI